MTTYILVATRKSMVNNRTNLTTHFGPFTSVHDAQKFQTYWELLWSAQRPHSVVETLQSPIFEVAQEHLVRSVEF